MPRLIIGSVPRGEDYFGREEFIETLWSRLERDNVLLVAPRRFGKTGAMYQLLDNPRQPFRPLYLDVEDITSPANFMVELIALLLRDRHFSRLVSSLWEESKAFGRHLRSLAGSIDLGAFKVEIREQTDVVENWLTYGDRVLGLLARETPRPLLMIDELPIMVESIAKSDVETAGQLLRWFRRARIEPGTGTRFVIGGSINLLSTLDALGLVDTVNDLAPLRLGAFDRDTAERYVRAIFASSETMLTDETLEALLELVGEPIPYFLGVLLTAVLDRQRISRAPVSPEVVRDAFEMDLLGGGTSAVFQHYRSRIDRYYPGPEGRAALAILGLLSHSDRAIGEDTLYHLFLQETNADADGRSHDAFKGLMQKLDNDFYVRTQGRESAFLSRVLRLWWNTHYGYQAPQR